jgi:peptidyl-prolyl cis-trans isomerase C
MKTQLIVIFALTATLGVLAGCSPKKQESPAIATVGEDKLTAEQLAAEIPEELQGLITREQVQEYVQRWINSQLLLQEAKRRGFDRKIELQWELRRVERELLVSKLLEEELDKQTLVSEEDARKYYEDNKESFSRESNEVHLFHILAPNQEEAKAIMSRLRAGEEFEAVARERASAGKQEGDWDLSYVSPEELIPEAAQKVFRARKGTVVPPIRSEFGYHIFKVVDKQPKGSVKSFEEVKEEITIKLLAQKRQQRFQQLLSRLRNETEIVTNYEILEQVLKKSAPDTVTPAPAQ